MHSVWVEVHPVSALFQPNMRRWRVMLDGAQQSTHETEREALDTAAALRERCAAENSQ